MTGIGVDLREVAAATWRSGRAATVVSAVLSPLSYVCIAASAATQRAIVDLPKEAGWTTIVLLACTAGLVWSLWSTSGWIRGGLQDLINTRAAIELRRVALRRIVHRAHFEDLSDRTYADAVELLRRGAYRLGSINWALYGGAMSALGLVASLVLLLTIDLRLVVVVLGAIASVVVGIILTAKRVRDEHHMAIVQRQERAVHEAAVLPRGVQEVRGYEAHEPLDQLASKLWGEMARRRLRTSLRGALMGNAAWALLGVGLVYGLIVLSGEVAVGRATAGDIVLLVTLTLTLDQQVWAAKEHLSAAGEAFSIARASRVVRDRAGHAAPPGDAVAVISEGIQLRDVRFRYRGATSDALRDIDLFLPAGTVVAIVGRNGAGKSTLANLLLGVLHPTSGRVFVDGEPIQPADWTVSTTGAFQDFLQPALTLLEAVGLGDVVAVHDEDRVRDALEASGGARLLTSLPDGLATSFGGAGGRGLSHGQWQLVAIARSWMRQQPALVVLDEPSSALDAHAEYELFERFVARGRQAGSDRGTVSVVITHRASSAALADLIVVIDDGRLVEAGSHEELMNRRGEYRRRYDMQGRLYR